MCISFEYGLSYAAIAWLMRRAPPTMIGA
jgi:hypothetical protein